MVQSNYRFIEWLPVSGNPEYVEECAVLKTFPNMEKAFIPLKCLDKIDLGRLKALITSRNASLYNDLSALLADNVIGNGMNSLAYFHQLTKILSPNGTVRAASSNQVLTGPRMVDASQVTQQSEQFQQPVNASQPVNAQQTVDVEPSFESVATSKPTNARK